MLNDEIKRVSLPLTTAQQAKNKTNKQQQKCETKERKRRIP